MMTSEMQRSDDEIVTWNLKKINADVSCFCQSLNEICERARTKRLDAQTAGPILHDMLMTVDLLQLDANALLQPCKNNIDGKWCREELKKSTEHAPSTEFPDQFESFRFFLDSLPLKEAKGVQLSHSQTVQAQTDTTYNSLVKHLNKIEEIVVAQNLLKRLEKIEQQQKARNNENKNISKRLEALEKLKLPADLQERTLSLDSDVCPYIFDRVETLENQVTELRKGVFGQNADILCQMESCISAQLSDLKKELDEGKKRLQTVEEKIQLRKRGHMLRSSPGEVQEVKESQSTDSTESKKSDEIWPGKNVPEEPTQVMTPDVKFVAFQVFLDHEGDWQDGKVMNKTTSVNHNHGHAFVEDSARFVAPVPGRYMFGLWVIRDTAGEESRVEVWRCRRDTYTGRMFYVSLSSTQIQSSYKQVREIQAGESVVVRAFGGKKIDFCMFEGSLINCTY